MVDSLRRLFHEHLQPDDVRMAESSTVVPYLRNVRNVCTGDGNCDLKATASSIMYYDHRNVPVVLTICKYISISLCVPRFYVTWL